MIIYNYDSVTGEYLGISKADPDPLDLNNWLIPANATTEKPMVSDANTVAVFDDGVWKTVVDHRGTNYFDKNGYQYTVETLGIELPEGALLVAPEILPTVEEQTALANAECTKRINAHWDQIGQINASLGIYGEEDTAACTAWIASNRKALVSLLAREDLVDIDVTDNQYWPVFE